MAKKIRIELNSVENLEKFLQEISDEAYRIQNQIQDEINKLVNSTDLTGEVIEGKARYAKALHDYYGDLDKANKQRLDVAKIMNEIVKFKGNVSEAMDSVNSQVSNGTMDIDALRKIMKEGTENTANYKIK